MKPFCCINFLRCNFSFVFQNKDKLEKLRGQAEMFCQRLGHYRMPFGWATVKIMDVISTAAIDRDVTDSDSLKGGVWSLCALFQRGQYPMTTHICVDLFRGIPFFQVNPAAWTGERSFPGGILNVTVPLMISFATSLPSNLLPSLSAPSSNRSDCHPSTTSQTSL